MTIEDASNFFIRHNQKRIATKLKALLDVGMGYVKLGQSSLLFQVVKLKELN